MLGRKPTTEISSHALSDLLKSADKELGVLTLVKGQSAGKAHWAYARIHPSRYLAFKETLAAGKHFNLADFADEIYMHGEGNEPPAATKVEMEEKYGANHHFEAELQLMMEHVDAHLDPK